jgi:hypothetical protein
MMVSWLILTVCCPPVQEYLLLQSVELFLRNEYIFSAVKVLSK